MFTNKFINKVANNKLLSYVLVSFTVVIIVLYPYLDVETKTALKKYIRNPNIMIGLVLSNVILSFYNFPLAILLAFFVLLVLSGQLQSSQQIEGFENDKGERKHYFMKHFGIDTTKMTNELQKGLEENRKSKIKTNIKTIKDNKKNTKKENGIAIRKRSFDLQNDDDTNLLNTREICGDIINRINYQYEDVGYLKKYISSRIEEIVDLNNLLENDD